MRLDLNIIFFIGEHNLHLNYKLILKIELDPNYKRQSRVHLET
jgi:hypothetical protein